MNREKFDGFEGFYQVPKNLWFAEGFISSVTGEFVPLSWNAKAVYWYVYERCKYFVEEKGGNYYESQMTIAKNCSLDRSTGSRVLELFREHNVLEWEYKSPETGGRERYFYKSVNKVAMCVGSKEDYKLIDITTHVNKNIISNIGNKDEYDSELPF